MNVYGLDFTSAPRPAKPITCACCRLDDRVLEFERLQEFTSFDEFEAFLRRPGPWIAGLDFPFGQPRRLVEALAWPQTWEGYIKYLSGMTKAEFVQLLADYRSKQPAGNKQHLRRTDEKAGSKSPMMLFGVPVGKMFFEGANRMRISGASIHPCRPNDDSRILVEAYPALVARKCVDRQSYKTDDRSRQTRGQQAARDGIVRWLRSDDAASHYGVTLHFPDAWAEKFILDGSGDQLDAVLCAVQAAWAYLQPQHSFGIPAGSALEGWIVDPALLMKGF